MATPAELDAPAAVAETRSPAALEADADETFARYRLKARKSASSDELALIDEAYSFAKGRHGDQRRADGRLYITHPVEVAGILAEQGLDATSQISALLHDVVEDTTPSKDAAQKLLDEIRVKFGPDVARCVDGVTKIRNLERYSR